MYFDTHAHIDDKKYDETRYSVIKGAIGGGVELIANIGADIESSRNSVMLAENYDFIYATVGVHPHETQNFTSVEIEILGKLAQHKKVCAIGEIGFDYHYDFSDKASQAHAFNEQMDLAKQLKMPVVIHSREAQKDTLDVLETHGELSGIVHSYSGSLESAKILLNLGYYLSFNGIITFKNSVKAKEIISYIPRDRLLIETDCPYLAPEPFRGKINTPDMVCYVAQTVADIWDVPLEEVAKITLENGKRVYNID